MDLHIEADRGTILIRQKWKYKWLVSARSTRWSYPEKRRYHHKADNMIWSSWGRHFELKVEGTSSFARKHRDTRWDVNFDIQWVLLKEHWKVEVTKYPSNHQGHPTSRVRWGERLIILDTKDTRARKRNRGGRDYYQPTLTHEFGHAVGNSSHPDAHSHGDEYRSTSNNFRDKNSLMNVGSELRDRHLDFILRELNTMIPDATFSKYE